MSTEKGEYSVSTERDTNCLFCRIVAGELPAERLYEDDQVIAFQDVSPQAPVHILVIPRKHVSSLDELAEADTDLAGHVLVTARKLAAERGLSGYRVVMNTNPEGGQTVFHMHLHLLGGRQMKPGLG